MSYIVRRRTGTEDQQARDGFPLHLVSREETEALAINDALMRWRNLGLNLSAHQLEAVPYAPLGGGHTAWE